MNNAKLELALKKFFKNEISERTKELEECKKVAFEIWDKICELHTNISPKSIKLYVSGLNIFLEYKSNHEKTTITFPYSHPKILEFVSIIASNSDIKGKIFPQGDQLTLTFSYPKKPQE